MSLVISMKDKKVLPTDNKEVSAPINWGEFSTLFSKQGLDYGLEVTNDLEELADHVHRAWILGVNHLWSLLEEGHIVEGGYSKEKRLSHVAMCTPYQWLSREDQLKDIYTIKDILSKKEWLKLGGEFYESEFLKYNIGW